MPQCLSKEKDFESGLWGHFFGLRAALVKDL